MEVIINAIILGIIQGLTEFLPISSYTGFIIFIGFIIFLALRAGRRVQLVRAQGRLRFNPHASGSPPGLAEAMDP